MKEPMKGKDGPALRLSEKLNMDLMRQHGACNYWSNPSGGPRGTSAAMIQSFEHEQLQEGRKNSTELQENGKVLTSQDYSGRFSWFSLISHKSPAAAGWTEPQNCSCTALTSTQWGGSILHQSSTHTHISRDRSVSLSSGETVTLRPQFEFLTETQRSKMSENTRRLQVLMSEKWFF